MKIQCDFCNKDEASIFCTADEAALCAACDHRVHHANKLASKHHRFSLLHPNSKDFPICDICQERRAFLFCTQDRAILCRECDVPIHAANEHTLKHNRFLLTGVKLSATSNLYSSETSAASSVTKGSNPAIPIKKPNSVSSAISNPNPAEANKIGTNHLSETSSISEYLIETLPGWRVEDLLDPSSFPFGFSSKSLDDGVLPFVDTDFDQNSLGSFSSERCGIWVPQSPAPLFYHHHDLHVSGMKETVKEKEATAAMKGSSNRRWSDDGFTVPQISPPSVPSNKRARHFW